jgi:hypothetical protein
MRPRRRLSEEERRALTIRQGELTALAQHPSWPVLEAVLDERREVFERELLVKMLGGDGVPLERQAFIRGFVKGMAYVLAIPAGAEARLAEVLGDEEAA